MQSGLKKKIPVPQDAALEEVAARYAVAVTGHVRGLIDGNDPSDPIARQYLPSAAELVTTPDELEDPIGDEAHAPVKGIVHRYPDRVLLKPVHVCAVYCRFCFRREKVGPGAEALNEDELNKAMAYIRNTPAIWEVILSGGDPLVLSPRRLKSIMQALNEMPHVQVIRFHTRVPVADPARVTDDLIAALESEKAVYAVLHCNHARELSPAVRAAAQKFIRAGIPLLSQSTLLKGVNDTAAALENLFRALTAMKIKPYYLHHPDLAPGTSHFRLTIAEGRALVAKIWGRMSGIAQARYVLDIPGGYGKAPADGAWLEEKDGAYAVTDYQGQKHRYKDSV
jgi:lysine 2,3-aminomutase